MVTLHRVGMAAEPDPAELIGAMVQVGSQGEEEEELVAMMKAIVVEGIDLIRDRRLMRCGLCPQTVFWW